jgi:hypothetical protein
VAAHAPSAVSRQAFGLDDDNRRPLLAIGETKWGETTGLPHLDRLRHIRDLTRQDRPSARTARLLCFSGAGFTPGLRAVAEASPDVVLISPGDLYART